MRCASMERKALSQAACFVSKRSPSRRQNRARSRAPSRRQNQARSRAPNRVRSRRLNRALSRAPSRRQNRVRSRAPSRRLRRTRRRVTRPRQPERRWSVIRWPAPSICAAAPALRRIVWRRFPRKEAKWTCWARFRARTDSGMRCAMARRKAMSLVSCCASKRRRHRPMR